MDELIKTIKYNELLSLYQNLLTDTQKEIMNDYFIYNLSLGEIAKERNISRAAIQDSIKKSMVKLDEFESKLHLLKRNRELLKITAKIKENSSNSQINKEIDKLERNIKDGI